MATYTITVPDDASRIDIQVASSIIKLIKKGAITDLKTMSHEQYIAINARANAGKGKPKKTKTTTAAPANP